MINGAKENFLEIKESSDDYSGPETWIFHEKETYRDAIPIDAIVEIFNKGITKLGSVTQYRNGEEIVSIWFNLKLSWEDADTFVSDLNDKYDNCNFFVECRDEDG